MHLGLSVVVGLLVVAIVLAIAAKRAQIPYNIALVVGGMLIAVAGIFPAVPRLDPEVVFLLCLPPLLFEGGITANLKNIRANALPITLLSTLGMLFAIGGTGSAAHYALGLSWGPALLLGATLSVTDTVSILYAFRRAKVPQRLKGIMEGESLFNDGTALVAYTTIAGVVVAGGDFSIPRVSAQVVLTTAGGLAVGLGLGFLAAFVIRRTEDPLTEIMATSALAYAAYAGAEQVHVSGVIAAVTAGLTVGSTLSRDATPSSQVAIHSFWEYVAFGVNTFLFLSVGLSTSPASLVGHLGSLAAAVACVFAGRALAIYLPFLFLRALRPAHAVPVRWQHVFVLGNIKGALSIALVLGLPQEAPNRALLIDIVFGVTFVSLVGQGLLLPGSLRWLGLIESDPVAEMVAERQARLIAARAAIQELETLHAAGLVPRDGYERLKSDYQVVIAAAERELRRLHEAHLQHGARALIATRRRLIDAERTALVAAHRAGMIPPATAERVLAALDERILSLDRTLEGEAPPTSGAREEVR